MYLSLKIIIIIKLHEAVSPINDILVRIPALSLEFSLFSLCSDMSRGLPEPRRSGINPRHIPTHQTFPLAAPRFAGSLILRRNTPRAVAASPSRSQCLCVCWEQLGQHICSYKGKDMKMRVSDGSGIKQDRGL